MMCSGSKQVIKKESPCATPCGVLFEGMPNGAIDCETLDEAERFTLEQSSKHLGLSIASSCDKLRGYTIIADPENLFMADVTFDNATVRLPVIGLTRCNIKQMTVAADSHWLPSSYSHEVMHAIQECSGPGVASEKDKAAGSGHEGWEEFGVWDFIDSLRSGEL